MAQLLAVKRPRQIIGPSFTIAPILQHPKQSIEGDLSIDIVIVEIIQTSTGLPSQPAKQTRPDRSDFHFMFGTIRMQDSSRPTNL
jgi:hypothetical protein